MLCFVNNAVNKISEESGSDCIAFVDKENIKGLKAVAAAAYGLTSRRFVKPSKIAPQNGQHYGL